MDLSTWLPDWSGYSSGSRANEAFRYRGGKPEQIWREQGPDAYKAFLLQGRDRARQGGSGYWGSPVSWFDTRLSSLDNYFLQRNQQSAQPDLSGQLSETQKELADLRSQFDAYQNQPAPSTPTPLIQPLGNSSGQGMSINLLDTSGFTPSGGGGGIYDFNFNFNPMPRQDYMPRPDQFSPPKVISEYRQPLNRVQRVRQAKERGRSLGTQQFNRKYRQLPTI